MSSSSATRRRKRSTSAGAFLDLTDKKAELGGDDLLPGFMEAGTYDGKFYAAPYYAGARIVFYRKALFEAGRGRGSDHARRLRRGRRRPQGG